MIERSNVSNALTGLATEVLARCDEVALYSEEPGKITRTFLSDPMRAVHARLSQWMREAGLRVRLDAAGNLIGRYERNRHDARVLAIGSHLDTVPDAGKYDGVLGVLLGLAAVKALSGRPMPFAIDVIAFSEEEGVRYHAPFLGSLAAVGRFDRQLLERTDAAGITMADAFRAFGLDPARIDEAAYPAGKLLGYMEVHIEQGPVLENWTRPPASSTAIAGQSRFWAELRGRAGHAGTTPMEGRHDALTAAAEIVLEIERLARPIDGLRATVGALAVEPGASNVIPAAARFSIDIRHAHDHVRVQAVNEMLSRARALAGQRGGGVPRDGRRASRRRCGRSALERSARRGACRHRPSPPSPDQWCGPRCRRHGGGCSHGDALSAQSRGREPSSRRTSAARGRRGRARSADTLSRSSGRTPSAPGKRHRMSTPRESPEWSSSVRPAAASGGRTP